jgi:hypothetical protein
MDTTKENNRFVPFAVKEDDGPAATVLLALVHGVAAVSHKLAHPAYQMGNYEPYHARGQYTILTRPVIPYYQQYPWLVLRRAVGNICAYPLAFCWSWGLDTYVWPRALVELSTRMIRSHGHQGWPSYVRRRCSCFL